MLTELAIQNFAIIESAHIEFGPRLNALTGETGAGKSILIDALGAVLGDRVSAEMVRTGARTATIDAHFSILGEGEHPDLARILDELEIEPEGNELILSREIQSGGRSVARINGRPTTASILTQVGSALVDVHGQSDHLSLLRASAQLELLDSYAHATGLREEFAAKYRELRNVRTALADARSGARDRMQRLDLLRYQMEEIERAGLRVGEEEELGAERTRLANADRLTRDAAAAYSVLSGDEEESPAAMAALRLAAQLMDDMAAVDPDVASLRERLNDLLFSLEDFAVEMRNYRDSVEADPARLEAVEERLDLLRQLKRKYGTDIEEILAHGRAAEREIASLTAADIDPEALAERERVLSQEAGALAGELSQTRKSAALTLANDVERAIAELNMGAAEFAVDLQRTEDQAGIPIALDGAQPRHFAADATGVDKVSFLIAPNAGEGLKPLSRIASGGETARLMLALKSILSDVDETPTLVFDEIDVGVGGRSGQVVGEKLWRLASAHQVIVITHLPQIAAYADSHFRIAKCERGQRVVSTVEPLDSAGREEEVAAMLDGFPVTASARRGATELLRRAARRKAEEGQLRRTA